MNNLRHEPDSVRCSHRWAPRGNVVKGPRAPEDAGIRPEPLCYREAVGYHVRRLGEVRQQGREAEEQNKSNHRGFVTVVAETSPKLHPVNSTIFQNQATYLVRTEMCLAWAPYGRGD